MRIVDSATPSSVAQMPAPVVGAPRELEPPVRRAGITRALALVMVVLVAATGAVSWRARAGASEEAARRDALKAVRVALPQVLGYDNSRLAKDIDEATHYLTPKFAEDYRALGEGKIRKTASRYQAVVVAHVVFAGLEAAEGDSAQALAFVNQSTKTSLLPAPRIDTSRVRVRLERVDGDWLISAIEPL